MIMIGHFGARIPDQGGSRLARARSRGWWPGLNCAKLSGITVIPCKIRTTGCTKAANCRNSSLTLVAQGCSLYGHLTPDGRSARSVERRPPREEKRVIQWYGATKV